MKIRFKAVCSIVSLFTVLSVSLNSVAEDTTKQQCAAWLNHELPQLHSDKTINLCEVSASKPMLVINTASYCGYTKQFGGLESLYQKYKDQGLVVIGFPSNSFNQEDDSAEKTASICYQNYGVTFLMTETLDVKGENAHPVFKHLAENSKAPSWNFNKYLVDRNGRVVQHFPSRTGPDSKQLAEAIETVL